MEVDPKGKVWDGVNLIHLTCGHDNEGSDFIQDWKFLEKPSEYQLSQYNFD